MSGPAFTRAHSDGRDEDCGMAGHGLEGQVESFCEYANKVMCSIKCKEFVDYLGNCLLFKEELCLLELVMVTCSWLAVQLKCVMFDFVYLD
jgi:hypothetical protein